LIMEFQNSAMVVTLILNPWFLIGMTLLSCYLLNSKIRLFALKFKTWSFKPNAIRYTFLIISLLLLTVLQFVAIPMLILLYIGMSLLDSYVLKRS